MIALLTSDLMFQSRFRSIAQQWEKTLIVDRTVERLVEKATEADSVSAVFIDLTLGSLDLEQVVPALRAAFAQAKMTAYGPHVAESLLSAAHRCGVDSVLTRGQLDRDLVRLIEQA